MYFIKPAVISLLGGMVISVALGVGAGPAQAAINSIDPADGATLIGTSQMFSWTGTANITEYWLYVGTTVGGEDILDSGSLGTSLSTTVNGLPTNGSTVHVRLWHEEEGTWLSTDFTYTASTLGGGLSAVPPWDQVLPAAERFVLVMGGAAVLDKETGLVWEQSPNTLQRNWDNARTHCAQRGTGDRMGWRLPSIAELTSLVVPGDPAGGPDLPPGHPFSNIQSSDVPFGSDYWSATTSAVNPTSAWSVGFIGGSLGGSSKPLTFFVWCVRGGMNADAY